MIRLSPEVADALAGGRPVVALESTVYSGFGLPAPANAESLRSSLAAVRAGGAVPAVTAVLDGTAWVGLDDAGHERVLAGDRKLAVRDLPVAMAEGGSGVTTVSASLALAAAAGVAVFATGGIGGVHRGAERTGDVSADLHALARFPVVTVCAGAKVFLDLPRTLEHLETLSVPVLGWRTDTFPAFWVRSTGLPVQRRVEGADDVAGVVRASRALGLTTGVLVAVPLPEADALPLAALDEVLPAAIAAAEAGGSTGAAVTPDLLRRLAEATGGRSVTANVSLVEQNARVAAAVATALAGAPSLS